MVTLLALGASTMLPAQELLWSFGPGQDTTSGIAPMFGDLDRDGCADLLCGFVRSGGGSFVRDSLRVFSGRDGTVLDDRVDPGSRGLTWFGGVGDFDLDGYPDYGYSWVSGGNLTLDIWSPHRHQVLYHDVLLGGPIACLDADGDGLPDIISGMGDVRAADRFGQTIWVFPVGPLQLTVEDLLAFDDLDGDGICEVIVGGVDGALGQGRGNVIVLSGRRGSLLRVAHDSVLGDLIGTPLARAGDVDMDGVEDYATGDWHGGGSSGRSVLALFSGANGSRLREWAATNYDISTTIAAGIDVDLDGSPDVVSGSSGYNNSLPTRRGRVQVFSSRDQQVLMHFEPTVDIYVPSYADQMASLGVQPGNPYPVIAFSYLPRIGGPSFDRLEVWRLSPPGSALSGAGCSSIRDEPTIGVRRIDQVGIFGSRIVLGSAPPAAWAFCVGAGVADTTFCGVTVPFSLDPLGFSGCTLLVPPMLTEQRTVGLAGMDRGYAAIDLPFQLDPAGFGAALQWLVLDPVTGSYAATPRLEVHLR